jgi:hypothetical protein
MSLGRRILFTAVLLALLVSALGPVSAYDISVYPVSTGPVLSDSFASRLSAYQSSTSSDILNLIKSSSSTYTGSGSVGSITAYSDVFSQDQTTLLRFSESVTVNGIINNFRYSAHFDSGFFQ